MGRASASALVPGRVSDAESLWYDLRRWPAFVDGFASVVQRDDPWPQRGATLIWDSTPHGRGRVIERVVGYELRDGQSVDYEDEKTEGTQKVVFAAEGEHTRVTLTMQYRMKDRNPLTPVVDFLFVRRAVNDSLRRTVTRFAHERQGDIALS
jgi:hypothetical protein